MRGHATTRRHYIGATSGPVQLTGRTMSDHIVVFDGNPRLAGQLLNVTVHEATAFTLFGVAQNGEHVGCSDAECEVPPAPEAKRFALPLL